MKFLVSLFLMLVMASQMNAQDACVCCSPEQTAFDFWLGTWTVTNIEGVLEGYNTIDKPNGDCMLRETYTNVKGEYVGASNNFYNTRTGKWEQIWVYADGRSLFLTGNKVGNQMILKSALKKNPAGIMEQDIITWTDNTDGTVRQLWERTFDGGNTKILFDAIYRKK